MRPEMRLITLMLLGGLAGTAAQARTYSSPVLAGSEDELRLLLEDGVITEEDFETLVDLFNNPVNINEASRNALYDLPGVTMPMARAIVASRRQEAFYNLEDLLGIEGIDESVVEQLYPFAVAEHQQDAFDLVKGRVRLRTAMDFQAIEPLEGDHANRSHRVEQINPKYGKLPATFVSTRVSYGKQWEAGAVLLAQEEISKLSYSPDSRDLYAAWGRPSVRLGKAFVSYGGKSFDAVVGNFGAGFGVGMTFDRTNRTHPQGFYEDISISGTDRYSMSRQLFGVAATGYVPLSSDVKLEITGFASSQRYDIYQYDIAVGTGEVVDPHEVELNSPRVYIDDQKAAYVTLPNAYRDSVVGLDVSADLGPRQGVGATAYMGNMSTNTIDGVEGPNELVLRGGYPVNPMYGAVGAHGSFGVGPVDFIGESAFTFTGGNGTLVKAVMTPGAGEITASLRRYGSKFDNPHARGLAAADEYRGFRDRDEQGARVDGKYDFFTWLTVRARADLWQNISYGRENLDLYSQVIFIPRKGVELMGFGQHTNRDLAVNGRSRVYGGSFEGVDEEGDEQFEVTDRAGARNQLGVQAKVDLIPLTRLSGYYRRVYEDDGLLYPNEGEPCEYWYMIGQTMWFRAQVDIPGDTRLIARVRYIDEDIHGSKGDRLAEGYLQVEQKLPQRVKLSLRGTLGRNLADDTAEWKDGCASGGIPDMNGSCIAEPEVAEAAEPGEPYGSVWLSAEWRF